MPNYYNLQEAFCKEYDRPIYVPRDGFCWRCNRNIWDRITADRATGEYITKCPFCGYSFCE